MDIFYKNHRWNHRYQSQPLIASYLRHVTDDTLLKNKKYREVMEDLPRRTERVHEFLRLFRPGIIYDIVPIQDVYGPTGWDPNIQGLVVSYETLSGAESSLLQPHLPLLCV